MSQHLYRLWDSKGGLLYVGISKSALGRIGQHFQEKEWASDIASMTIEHFPDRASVERAEKYAIARENPLHNKQRFGGLLNEKPIEDLWSLMSNAERRMVGQVMTNISDSMRVDDARVAQRDENYLTLAGAIWKVGHWFQQDAKPQEMVNDLIFLVGVQRQRAIDQTASEYEKIADQKDLVEKLLLANEQAKAARAECKLAQSELKKLRAGIKSDFGDSA